MRRDYSIPQRAEDRWEEMHRSAREQRLLKQLAEVTLATGPHLSLASRFLTWVLGLGRTALRVTRKAAG